MTGAYDGTHKPGEPGDFEFAGYVVEAEIDRDTGAVQIHDVLLVADVGTIINPVAHQGQLEGGLVMGLGAALMEDLQVQDGQVTTATLGDYKIPCMMDMPAVQDRADPRSAGWAGAARRQGGRRADEYQRGAGRGERGRGGCGARVTHMPVTAERVLEVLEASGA